MSITVISDTRLQELLNAEQTLKTLEEAGISKWSGYKAVESLEAKETKVVSKRPYRVHFQGVKEAYMDVYALSKSEAVRKATEQWKRECAIPIATLIEENK